MMIKIDAIVREEKFEDVKAALNAIGVNGITVSQVMGCGVQRGYKEIVRGMEVAVQMLPKIKFEIVVSSEEWEQKTIEAIQKAAFTGEVGDGKIFSYEIRSAQKIRTGETGCEGNKHVIEYSLKLDSNPEFTGSVLVAYARAAYRLSKNGESGARSVFDIAPAMLSQMTPEELRSHLL